MFSDLPATIIRDISSYLTVRVCASKLHKLNKLILDIVTHEEAFVALRKRLPPLEYKNIPTKRLKMQLMMKQVDKTEVFYTDIKVEDLPPCNTRSQYKLNESCVVIGHNQSILGICTIIQYSTDVRNLYLVRVKFNGTLGYRILTFAHYQLRPIVTKEE